MEVAIHSDSNRHIPPPSQRSGDFIMVSTDSTTAHEQLRNARLELNVYKPDPWPLSNQTFPAQPKTPGEWFSFHFPDQARIYGAPFIELREKHLHGFQTITPLSINLDFFAAVLGGDERLGHRVIYLEHELQFY